MDKTKKANKKNYLYLFLLILLGGFIGSILGEILGFNFEEGNFLHTFLTKGIVLGLTNPFFLDLKVFTLNFGFTIKFSFLSVLGFLFGIFLYKK
ncbi:DUF4321 domain-containing protein, partial [bacterium]|nr:DUF4321 domain-containing protein [bacterium]